MRFFKANERGVLVEADVNPFAGVKLGPSVPGEKDDVRLHLPVVSPGGCCHCSLQMYRGELLDHRSGSGRLLRCLFHE